MDCTVFFLFTSIESDRRFCFAIQWFCMDQSVNGIDHGGELRLFRKGAGILPRELIGGGIEKAASDRLSVRRPQGDAARKSAETDGKSPNHSRGAWFCRPSPFERRRPHRREGSDPPTPHGKARGIAPAAAAYRRCCGLAASLEPVPNSEKTRCRTGFETDRSPRKGARRQGLLCNCGAIRSATDGRSFLRERSSRDRTRLFDKYRLSRSGFGNLMWKAP